MLTLTPTNLKYSFDERSGRSSVSFAAEHKDGILWEVWFSFSKGAISRSGDFLVPIFLPAAMKNHGMIKIPTQISSLLMKNLADIQHIYKTWNKDFTLVNVIADNVSPALVTDERKNACFYSGRG